MSTKSENNEETDKTCEKEKNSPSLASPPSFSLPENAMMIDVLPNAPHSLLLNALSFRVVLSRTEPPTDLLFAMLLPPLLAKPHEQQSYTA
jgi:hypothetical protein